MFGFGDDRAELVLDLMPVILLVYHFFPNLLYQIPISSWGAHRITFSILRIPIPHSLHTRYILLHILLHLRCARFVLQIIEQILKRNARALFALDRSMWSCGRRSCRHSIVRECGWRDSAEGLLLRLVVPFGAIPVQIR